MKPSERAEVRRTLSAPPERLTVLELDFREGGHYRLAYDTPEGQRMLVGGVYRKIEAPTRLVFS